MIDYQLLQALAAVISEKGFEKAAKKLFITQSAVSRRIQNLESLLGEPVLVRTQPPAATATGKRLLNHLQQVLQLEVALGIDSVAGETALDKPLTVRLATNADSLATWLPEALAHKAGLKFDLVVDDQSVNLKRMKAGEVMACVSSDSQPVNGGLVSYLGALRYRAVASPAFIKQHYVDSKKQLVDWPCLVFDEDDKLQHHFIREMTEGAHSAPSFVHLCPSPEGFKQSAIAGLGYGMLPEIQTKDAIERGELVDVRQGYVLDTPLYWHYWQTESPQLKALRERALHIASKKLIQL